MENSCPSRNMKLLFHEIFCFVLKSKRGCKVVVLRISHFQSVQLLLNQLHTHIVELWLTSVCVFKYPILNF